jgi:predicted RNase H-like HicB family nuclease
MSKNIILKNIVWKEGDMYVSQSLNTGVASCGKTKKEALKNLDEAIDLFLEDRKIKLLNIGKIQLFKSKIKSA